MDAMMLKGLVTVESAPAALPSEPERVVRRSYPGAPHHDAVELDVLSRSYTLPGPAGRATAESGFTSAAPSAPETPGEERQLVLDVERSGQSTPTGLQGRSVDALQTMWNPRMNRFRFAAVCFIVFSNGLHDASAGALLPYMEVEYNLGYALVSLIFVGNAVGFIVAAAFLDMIRERLGRGRAMIVSEVLLLAAYIPLVCTAPFPVIVVSFFMVGFSMSINLALCNTFCGTLANSTTALGLLHGSYGVGGVIGPLIATTIVNAAGSIWSRYYFITLGLSAFNAVFAGWSFWGYEKDELRAQLGQTQEASWSQPSSSPGSRYQASGVLSALSSRVVLLGALFIFAYQGAEVSISGWVISFLITTRNGDPSKVGYVTAGFWAGITLGRFLLSAPAHRIGEKTFVYGVTVGAIVFELLVWLVPNVIGNAVAVSIVGLLLGPVYPCAAAVFMRSLSKHEQVSGLGVITAFGSSGGAAAPFTTGILAQAAGTFVLHPIAIALFGVMMVCWYGMPSIEKRDE
ncbi:MFS general substrate transporter [Thozetella sp. PMI_491]|nr:MFS general substrate transporter [Thozetella sp. PMI_491]